MELDVFCSFCGKKRCIHTDQPKKTDQPEKGALTLLDFQHMKTEERTSSQKSCQKNFVLKRKHLYQHKYQQNQS